MREELTIPSQWQAYGEEWQDWEVGYALLCIGADGFLEETNLKVLKQKI